MDEEIVFTGYTMRLTSAYYPNEGVAYAMAVDTADNMNYLIEYEWSDPNDAPDLYPLKGFSEDPTAGTYAGNPHLASIIYAVNTDTYDMPVKGYIVGSTRSIWAWNDCLAPDFGVTSESYQQLFTSPGALVGIVSKIDLDVTSCNHEHVNVNTSIVGTTGLGINDGGYDLIEFSTANEEDGVTFNPTVLGLTTTSADASMDLSQKPWESVLDLSQC